ncbi:MAG: hypothetical protein KGL29_04665 [Alphaproteobacteria bacterium]|nr:hypothetical protein [Alphaproteobacteria bacterium]MDE2498692.1 hypothetical protein [Alphaproteobacteria bacterium]
MAATGNVRHEISHFFFALTGLPGPRPCHAATIKAHDKKDRKTLDLRRVRAREEGRGGIVVTGRHQSFPERPAINDVTDNVAGHTDTLPFFTGSHRHTKSHAILKLIIVTKSRIWHETRRVRLHHI